MEHARIGMSFKDYIRDVQDFPKEGVSFKDISPLLSDPDALMSAMDELETKLCSTVLGSSDPEAVVGLDARGFIFGSLYAAMRSVPFVMARKEGKLPPSDYLQKATMKTEYSEETLVMDAPFLKGAKVVIIDDCLATGGTAEAAARLVQASGGTVVGFGFLVEITSLMGSEKLCAPYCSLVKY